MSDFFEKFQSLMEADESNEALQKASNGGSVSKGVKEYVSDEDETPEESEDKSTDDKTDNEDD